MHTIIYEFIVGKFVFGRINVFYLLRFYLEMVLYRFSEFCATITVYVFTATHRNLVITIVYCETNRIFFIRSKILINYNS